MNAVTGLKTPTTGISLCTAGCYIPPHARHLWLAPGCQANRCLRLADRCILGALPSALPTRGTPTECRLRWCGTPYVARFGTEPRQAGLASVFKKALSWAYIFSAHPLYAAGSSQGSLMFHFVSLSSGKHGNFALNFLATYGSNVTTRSKASGSTSSRPLG